MASVAVPSPFSLPVAPAATASSSSSKPVYTYLGNGTGGINYYADGKPITNTQYRAGTGVDTNALESQMRSNYNSYNASQTSGSAPSSNGSAVSNFSVGGATVPVGPTAAQTDPLLASLGSLDTVLGNKNQQSQDEFNRAISGYDAQDALDKQAYDQNVTGNEQALTSGNQAALLSAANGATGLRGVLSSLGALAGSGRDVVKRLLGLAINSDTGSVRNTFDTNAKTLNQNFSQTTQQERQRRDDANATLSNNMQNNQSNVLTSKQSIYQQLANLYGAGTGQGNDYASKATALAAPIAATTRATIAPYASASSLYSPAALQTYLAGTQNLNSTSSTADATPINSPIFSLTTQKRDNLPGVA